MRSTCRRCPASRSTSRRSWCCPPRPARRSPRSSAARAEQPEARLRADGLRARCSRRAAAAARHDRRRACGQSLRPAPPQGRRGARPHARRQRRVRPRRGLQVGRARGEERHRLRPLQAAGRLLGHARRADRRDLQGAAGGRDRDDAGDPRARRRGRDRRDGAGDGLERRGLGRGAPALRRDASVWRATCAAARPRRCCASKVLARPSPTASRR